MEQARQGTDDMAHQAQQKAAALADKAKEQVTTQIAGQKDRATDQLSSITTALRQTSDSLRQQDQGAVAGYIDDAARQVDRLADYLRHHTVGELLDEAERYARREPALFLGGAVLLGLFSARFFKSSRPQPEYVPSRGRAYGPRRASRPRPYAGGSSGGRYRPMDERDFYEEERISGRSEYRRPSRTGRPDYDTVHGTSGAEMPNPSEGQSRSGMNRGSDSGTTTGSNFGTGSDEGRR